MKTGIYGGTFSPPHKGHIGAAKAFYEQIGLDELLIIPTAVPPHKAVGYTDDPQKRLCMCRLAFGDISCASVSDMEIRRGGKSYTVLTLRELEKEGRELYLLCGTDMILTLDTWFCAEEIFSLCTPVAIRRESDPESGALVEKKLAEYKKRFSVDIPCVSYETVEISSSEIRERIKNGEDVGEYLTPEVEDCIRKNRMYAEGEK